MKAKRLQARATEKEQKRLHVPTVDRSTGEPAPFVVVVQGPPKVIPMVSILFFTACFNLILLVAS